MGSNDLRAFFHPASVAVIGASETPGKFGHEILKNLVEGGYYHKEAKKQKKLFYMLS